MTSGYVRLRASCASGVCRLRRSIRVRLAQAALAAAIGVTLSCGSSSPARPAPPPQQNQPPVITAIEIQPARIELNEEVSVRVTVQDAETAPEQLVYEWSADGGTFTGQGASVTWRPPADADTPADFVLRLTVRERFGNASGQTEHSVNGSSPPVRVHDSPTELREMSLKFLELFADSDRTASECLVDFSDSCRGKQSEREDIEDNRRYYEIRSSSLDFEFVDIATDRQRANMIVECEFRSRYRRCPPDAGSCVVGETDEISGLCLLTAVYENNRWWLCDSHFDPEGSPSAVPLRFFGRSR
jgi:hypothetical protein